MNQKWVGVMVIACCLIQYPGSVLPCTMPLPEPEPEDPPHPICVVYEGINPVTHNLSYLIGIEVDLYPPQITMQCQCGVNFGVAQLPQSFSITSVSLTSVDGCEDNGNDVKEFEGFEQDVEVEDLIEGLEGVLNYGQVFGFAKDIDPFTPSEPDPGATDKLFFRMEVSLADLPLVNGIPIQFAAGADSVSHPLYLFQGYQAAVVFAPPGDQDGDGRIANDDTRILSSCLIGPAGSIPATGCGLVDTNHDLRADLHDFALFQSVFTGR